MMNKKKSIITLLLASAILTGYGALSMAAEDSTEANKLEKTISMGVVDSEVKIPDYILTGDARNNVTVGSIGGSTFCLAEHIQISQGEQADERYSSNLARFQNGTITMPLNPAPGYQKQVSQKLEGEATTKTTSKYPESRKETLGETSKTAKAAYLAAHYEEHKHWTSDVQAGIWTTVIAVEKQDKTNPIEREAEAYETFVKAYEEKAKDKETIIKDTKVSAKDIVATDIEKKTKMLGKYSIDYVRGVTKEDGREKVEFGGIVGATLYDQDNNKIDDDAWEFVPVSVAEGKERTIVPEYDREYKYPYPNEPFYIKIYEDKLKKGTTSVSTIKYQYQRLDVRADVEFLDGTIDEITWKCKETYRQCFGPRRELRYNAQSNTWQTVIVGPGVCGRVCAGPHKFDQKYFVTEAGRKSLESQPLMIVTKIKKDKPTIELKIPTSSTYRLTIPNNWPLWPFWPDYPNYPDNPNGDLTFTIAGTVWEDTKTGKESNYDGKIGTANSGEKESGIKNVQVKLYKHGSTDVIKSTYTDKNGAYVFNEIPTGTYDVGFVYDGMTYTTTKAFSSGSASDYEKNPNDEKYILDSKAEELPTERQEFNNKFYEITANGSNGVGLGVDAISYETSNGKSKLQTTYSDGKVKPAFQLETKTSNTISVGYPFSNYVNNSTIKATIGGQEYYENYKYMAYVNLGLQKRPEVDFALTKDVYTATLTINNKQMDYKYNSRNEDTFDIDYKKYQDYSNKQYNRAVYKSDYTYRIDAYKNSLGTVSQADLTGVKYEDQELKVFVTYKVKIANQSEIYSGTINELVDFYDKEYVLIENDLKLDIRNDDGTLQKDKVVAEAPYYVTASGERGDLKLEKDDNYDNKNYKKVYLSGIEDKILQTGDYIYLYITFEVDKDDATRSIKTDNNSKDGKNNQIEISKYSTFDALAVTKTDTMGMIDRDSQPGNLDPDNDSTMEDDSDKAPSINIVVDEGGIRKINGTVWEDERGKAGTNTYSTGDGIRDQNEKGINGVTVQLVEIITAKDGTKYEYIWQEMNTGDTGYRYMDISGTLLNSDYGEEKPGSIKDGIERGQYKFQGYVPGDYIVRFKYGGDERTIVPENNNGTSYNGQDYKSTVYLSGDDINREWFDYNNNYLKSTLLSDAKDREDRRVEVMRYSREMKYDIAEVLASPDEGNKNLYSKLAENTQMTAETAKMRVEVEYATTSANGERNDSGYDINNIDFGLVQRPKAKIDLDKEIVGIKITLADGTTLIDTESGLKKNVNWVPNRDKDDKFLKGAVHIYMDEEVMQGANIQIKYKITVTNNSELDYTGLTDSSVGTAYYTGQPSASDRKVTTAINYIGDYVDSTLVYRPDDNSGSGWKTLDQIDKLQSIENMMNNGYLPKIENQTELSKKYANVSQILVNDALSGTYLLPGEKAERQLVLSKTLTASKDAEEDPTFDNTAEIIKYTNLVGRRADIPGNQDPSKIPAEADTDCTETITITPPTGENRAYYFVITGVALTIVAVGVFVIKKKVLDK